MKWEYTLHMCAAIYGRWRIDYTCFAGSASCNTYRTDKDIEIARNSGLFFYARKAVFAVISRLYVKLHHCP